MIGSAKPRVTIGMPIYNAENYVREALDALLSQTYSDFELIISDNASEDNTEAICREYASKDSRIKYYRNETNLGAAKNFNSLVERAQGEYFKWASHDDIHEPEYVERCVEVLDRESAVILCYPKAYEIELDPETKVYTKSVYTENLNIRSSTPHKRLYELLETFGWYHATQAYGLMRTEILKKTSMLGNYPHSDRVLLAELALWGEFHEVPEFLFTRRVHQEVAQIKNNTYETLAAWFDTKNKGKIMLPRWRRYIEYCRAVARAELSKPEEILCYLEIARRLVLSPGLIIRVRGIFEDLIKAGLRWVLGLFPKSNKPTVT